MHDNARSSNNRVAITWFMVQIGILQQRFNTETGLYDFRSIKQGQQHAPNHTDNPEI